ncbi:MAG TPA: sigma-70 family RNA polymerase sigma factor [Candidatus Binatia bacterium]|jgi:RNA polymerase sigma-70 factor (ECF subfamily)|nr:sigma-70 family RNA polymerase sigma factor [Candidatus Binatia bacterium]
MKGLAFSALSLLCSRTDEEAMCRVKTHDDHHEFARLLKRWEEPIRRLCTRMTGDAHRGEDLKQEAFLRLFERRKDYEPTGRFSTYLWRIALNLCYDELRRQERRREFVREPDSAETAGETPDCPADGPGPDGRAVQQEEGELVRQALCRLPDIYRTVIVLRHYEDMKLGKIAELLDIPEGTVNSRMAEALARLSRLLEPKLRAEPAEVRRAEAREPRPQARGQESAGPGAQAMILGRERFVL